MKTRAPIQNTTNDDQRVINRRKFFKKSPMSCCLSSYKIWPKSCYFQLSAPEKKQRVPSAYNKFIKYAKKKKMKFCWFLWNSFLMGHFNFTFTFEIWQNYLKFREEIQRIKANNPDITHREAFSTAAKNVSTAFNFFNIGKYGNLLGIDLLVSENGSGHITHTFNASCWKPTISRLRMMWVDLISISVCSILFPVLFFFLLVEYQCSSLSKNRVSRNL